MLGIQHHLYFPSLVFLKEAKLVRNNVKNDSITCVAKNVNLYTLDWTNIDQKREEKFNKWLCEQWPDKKASYIKALPDLYDDIFSNLIFSLDYKYLDHIHYCCQMAYQERGKPYPFDTMIRDICCVPAESYVFVAFRLLCDGIFSEEEQYWNHDQYIRSISWHALLYKFWHEQTGRGLIWDRAKMDELNVDKEYVRDDGSIFKMFDGHDENIREKIRTFYVDMKNHSSIINKNYQEIIWR